MPLASSLLKASTIKDALDLIAKAQFYAGIVDVSLGSNDCSSVCAALTKRRRLERCRTHGLGASNQHAGRERHDGRYSHPAYFIGKLSSNVAGPGSIDIIYVRNRTQALLVLVQSGPNIIVRGKEEGHDCASDEQHRTSIHRKPPSPPRLINDQGKPRDSRHCFRHGVGFPVKRA